MSYYGVLLCWVFVAIYDRNASVWTTALSMAILLTGLSIVITRCKPLWQDGEEFVYGSRERGRRFTAAEVQEVRPGTLIQGISLLRIATEHFVGYTAVDRTELEAVMGLLVPVESGGSTEQTIG